MVSLHRVLALTGRNGIAQGEALGGTSKNPESPERASPARESRGVPKGRCPALSGLKPGGCLVPRALPWAIPLRPFGAKRRPSQGPLPAEVLRSSEFPAFPEKRGAPGEPGWWPYSLLPLRNRLAARRGGSAPSVPRAAAPPDGRDPAAGDAAGHAQRLRRALDQLPALLRDHAATGPFRPSKFLGLVVSGGRRLHARLARGRAGPGPFRSRSASHVLDGLGWLASAPEWAGRAEGPATFDPRSAPGSALEGVVRAVSSPHARQLHAPQPRGRRRHGQPGRGRDQLQPGR